MHKIEQLQQNKISCAIKNIEIVIMPSNLDCVYIVSNSVNSNFLQN